MDWARLLVSTISLGLSLAILLFFIGLFWYILYKVFLRRFQFVRELFEDAAAAEQQQDAKASSRKKTKVRRD